MGEVGFGELCVAEHGPLQVSPMKTSPLSKAIGEVGLDQAGTVKDGAFQERAGKCCPVEHAAGKVGVAEVGSLEVGTGQIHAGKVRPFQLGAFQILTRQGCGFHLANDFAGAFVPYLDHGRSRHVYPFCRTSQQKHLRRGRPRADQSFRVGGRKSILLPFSNSAHQNLIYPPWPREAI